MLERLWIALGIIVVAGIAFVIVNWLQRRRATSAARGEAGGPSTGHGPRVLYFRSDDCTSCATQSQQLEELDAQTRSLIEKVDVDRERERAEAYNILTLPTTLVMDETGEVKYMNYGVVSHRRLREQLASLRA